MCHNGGIECRYFVGNTGIKYTFEEKQSQETYF